MVFDNHLLIPTFVYEKTNSKENLKFFLFLLTSFFFSVIRFAKCDGGGEWKLLHLISDLWSLMMRP